MNRQDFIIPNGYWEEGGQKKGKSFKSEGKTQVEERIMKEGKFIDLTCVYVCVCVCALRVSCTVAMLHSGLCKIKEDKNCFVLLLL